MATPQAVITDSDNTTRVPAMDLKYELAAVSASILDKEDDRRSYCKDINEQIKKLKKRQRELCVEIRSGGSQLVMHFGTEDDGNTDDDGDA